jgi:DNA-binding GntR family transcriptional regulator
LRHITEFRERVESDVATLATVRMKASDKKELKRLLDEARKHAAKGSSGVSGFLTADKKLHLCFAKISGNPIYFSILKTIHENNQRYYDEYLEMQGPEMKENLKDLENIINAMTKGEAGKAGQLVRTHVKRFSRYMEAHKKRDG